MEPRRTSSEIAKLITALCKAGTNLPKSWTSADLIALIKAYSKLIATSTAQQPTGKAPDVDDMQNGRPGAYEAMVKRAKQSGVTQ